MQEKRKHSRSRAKTAIELSHEDFGTLVLSSRDISEGGVYVFQEPGQVQPPLGTIVQLEVRGVMGQPVQQVQAEVVRADADGIGMRFLQNPFVESE
jgi:hypothetical protein